MSSTLASQKTASRTASDCAAIRAAVYFWTRCESSDYFASYFVRGSSASLRTRLGVMLARLGARSLTQRLISHVSPGVDVFLFARQAVPDGMIRQTLERHPETQVVILGAGFDTSGIRINRERAESGQAEGAFFELDLPASQAEKRRLMTAAASAMGTRFSEHVHYVPCAFGDSDISAALIAAGFDVSMPTLWVWSGVIHYLSEDAIRSTLSEIKSLSTRGAKLFFDYVLLEAYEQPSKYGFAKTKARFDSFGEVMSFGFYQGKSHVKDWLAGQGFTLEQLLTAEDMVAIYEDQTRTVAPSKGSRWSNFCIASLDRPFPG